MTFLSFDRFGWPNTASDGEHTKLIDAAAVGHFLKQRMPGFCVLSVARPQGRDLESKGTPATPSMVKLSEIQQTRPGNISDLGILDTVMHSKDLNELVPGLDQTELGTTSEESCIEAPVLSAMAPSIHCWQMAHCGDNSHPVVNCRSKLSPLAAEVVLVDIGPKLAPCPSGLVRVEGKNDPLVNMPLINHYPQGGLGEDEMSSVPRVILDPTPSVLPMNLQLDDRPPVEAEFIDSLAPSSSPSPHVSPADQLRKAPDIACHDRRLSSFAEVLSCGLGAASDGFSVADLEASPGWALIPLIIVAGSANNGPLAYYGHCAGLK
ncbi:hypothetical protein Nepgr_015896 [Nepenthes gracilis]|uniref:Uncharacterized protein n=1 Tax=Nepenthes gracilis TaxID=150966 RepID=A0AAD3XS16_NEPGR|nr:hypothetical protein Nepgr_015896 [Nepenthes gracilis]